MFIILQFSHFYQFQKKECQWEFELKLGKIKRTLRKFLTSVHTCIKKNTATLCYNLVPLNSRCCCNEAPPTTGWTLDFLLALYRKLEKLFTRKLSEMCAFTTSVCCMKHTHFLHLYNKRMLCEHDCVKFHGHIAWHSFCKNNFAEFHDEVRVKINQDFVQSLVVFCYSNICYFPLYKMLND